MRWRRPWYGRLKRRQRAVCASWKYPKSGGPNSFDGEHLSSFRLHAFFQRRQLVLLIAEDQRYLVGASLADFISRSQKASITFFAFSSLSLVV